jgi:chloride channel protein, CIC family
MKKEDILQKGIPISVSLEPTIETEIGSSGFTQDKKRLIRITLIAFVIAVAVSMVARLLVSLIDLITNISFYGNFSFDHTTPVNHSLGFWVIFIPAVGGLIVGLMALYGSKAIRGHGIPEAMEQILTNQSRIRPSIMYLKPLSAAVSIGTGGPFGAEGPIIATGGALGSTVGQILKITHNERKILLAAGATAGMSAIFGSPVAAIFLAIELLLFEFSPRSIIPVAIACITGAAGHHLFFEEGPVFPMPDLDAPANSALALYSAIGIVIGLFSALVTKIVYFIEDSFEKLPIHWAWWPALGGLGVGLIGYYAPRTLGVGYENITSVLSGSLPLQVVLSLCLLKFISWTIALGSGTSGGTLAPLLTIGGATGALLGLLGLYFFPGSGLVVPMAALVGMSALFAGASRALLTSIIFALETTNQAHALLPLLAACTAAYLVSLLFMKNTIMTEKIARRGVRTPHSYEPDILEKITVGQVVTDEGLVLSSDAMIGDVRAWLKSETGHQQNYYVVADKEGTFQGILSSSNLFSSHHATDQPVGVLIRRKKVSVANTESLRRAAEIMAKENVDVLPVIDPGTNTVAGVLSYKDVISAYGLHEHVESHPNISLKREGYRILLKGKRHMTLMSKRNKR